MAEPTPRRRSSTATRILIAITLLGMVVFVTSVGLAAWLLTRADRGDVADGSYLFVKLSGTLPEAPRSPGLFEDPEDFPPIASEVAAAFRKAATDDRISGIYLQLDDPSLGWAQTQELRSALGAVRAAGKPCVAYADGYDTKDYYLASVCDKVLIAPGGFSMVGGLAVMVTYYAGTFEKLGMEAEFEHVGQYKTFVEPYERTEPSESAVVAYEGLVDSLYSQFVRDVAASRGMSEDAVRAAVDDMHLSAPVNVERGLYDGVAYPDAVRATIDHNGDEGWVATLLTPYEEPDDDRYEELYTPLGEYLKEMRADESDGDAQIAIVHAEGAIVSGDGDDGLFGGSDTLADRPFRKWMRDARQDEDVKAVVLRVDSPGGSALASEMMWHEIAQTRAAGKPVVVSMTDYAASGGYYISCGADWIVAEPGTLTGSIGIGGGKINLAGTYEKIGLTEHHFKRGARSDLLAPTVPFSEDGREMFRQTMREGYDGFVSKVAEGRKMSVEAVDAVAQGRVWTGEQALERGLVDELGGVDVAIAKAAELSGVQDYGVERWPQRKSFLEELFEEMSGSPKVKVELSTGSPVLDATARDLLLLSDMLDDGPVALLPGNLRVE